MLSEAKHPRICVKINAAIRCCDQDDRGPGRSGMNDWMDNSAIQPPNRARRRGGVAVPAILLAGLLLAAFPAFSQTRAERRMEIRQARRMDARQAMRMQATRRRGFFARLRDLPPKEQERVLKNDRRFQNLPPERQQKIRENLQHWNQLSPDQKDQIRKRDEIYSQLTPQQRQNVREMSGEWRDLRPAERMRVRMALRRMRAMTPEERQQFLDSPQFQERFSPDEQKIVRGLSQLFPDADAPDQ